MRPLMLFSPVRPRFALSARDADVCTCVAFDGDFDANRFPRSCVLTGSSLRAAGWKLRH